MSRTNKVLWAFLVAVAGRARACARARACRKQNNRFTLHQPVASPVMPSKSVATKPPASGSEDEIGASDQENSRPAHPKINRTVVKKPVKKATAAATKKTTTKIKAAKEPVDQPEASDADDNEPAMEPAPKLKQRKRVLKKDVVAKNVAPAPEPESVPEPEAEPAPAPAKKTTTKSAKVKAIEAQPDKEKPVAKPKPKTKRALSPELAPVIPETQPQPTEIEQSIVEEEPPADFMDIDREPLHPPPPPKARSRQRSASIQRQAVSGAVYSRARSTSRQPGAYSRGHSASDTERRVAESEANRRLADMTKKYEEMRMKYDSVIELGPKAAEANFERLKKATDQKAKGETSPRRVKNPQLTMSTIDANDLIASLKKELAEIRKTSSATITDSAKLQSQVAALTAENEKLREEHKATVTSLTESQNESKALTAKLEAARKTNAATDKVPGSAVKKLEHGKGHGVSAESVKENALKEELYRDLTGLIITSVKRKDGEDEYSCIQTGRNGSKF